MRQLLSLLFTLFLAGPAIGQVGFEANSSFDAEILSGGAGVTFTWEVFPEIEDVFLDGSATGFADASNESARATLAVGSVFDLFATANGTANSGGLSSVLAANLGLLTVENTSSSAQGFGVEVNWSLVADSSTTDSIFDIAFGFAGIDILQDFDTELLSETAMSDLFSGQGRIELSDSLTIGFELEPNQIVEFDFLVSADGFGSTFSVVPEPNGLVGLLLASATFATRRRR